MTEQSNCNVGISFGYYFKQTDTQVNENKHNPVNHGFFEHQLHI